MSNEIKKAEASGLDTFTGFTDEVVGQEERRPQQGPFVKFTNESEYIVSSTDEVLSPEREFVIVAVDRVEQKWSPDGMPIETIYLAPGQKFRDLKAVNESTPREEWRTGPDGNPCGPWQAQHIVRLVDPAIMDRYSYATGTIGGSIAVRECVERTVFMRKFRGETVFPIVTLSSTHMPTRFGGRQRPHLDIKRFVKFGPGGAIPVLPDPGSPVAPPTAGEATGDSVPY
jgi:hypothetical protein